MTIKLSTFACVTVTTFLLGTTLAALSAAKTYSDMYKHYWKLF